MLLSDYKWYRKLKGGKWYYNRHIFDLGRGMVFIYERHIPTWGWIRNIEQYNEEWQ